MVVCTLSIMPLVCCLQAAVSDSIRDQLVICRKKLTSIPDTAQQQIYLQKLQAVLEKVREEPRTFAVRDMFSPSISCRSVF